MKWKYLKSIAFLPVILLSSSCSTNYLVKDNNKAVKNTQKINFYTNNIDDKVATFHNIQYLDNTNFINAFEKEETNNDYYFYNQKTLDDFNQQKLISPFKLTKSIRDYFDFDKTNIDFELWKDKLWEFKVKTTEFLSVWRNEEIDRNLPFDKIGRLFGQMFFCIGPAKLKSFNFILLEQITHNYIQNLNSFYKTNFVSLNDFPKNTPYFQSVLFYLSLLNDQLLYLEEDNHTFLFLSNETEIDSFEYISYNQIVLYLKRIYFEIVYTFDYLHIINKLLTNFYSPNLDTEQDVIKAKEMSRDLGIFFLVHKQQKQLANFYENWREKLYKVIDPNYFFGYVFNLDSKEKLISIDIDKNAIGIEDTYNSLDFINWIYKLENSNLTKIFEMILEQTDYQKTTFWEKIITNHNRKYELLKLYLEMNFEENTNNNSFWKFKQKFIESLQLDYHWRLEDGKEL